MLLHHKGAEAGDHHEFKVIPPPPKKKKRTFFWPWKAPGTQANIQADKTLIHIK